MLTAQVELDRAQVRLKKLAVVAPFNGAIVKKMAEVGQWAEPGTPIAELVSRGQIDAVIDVPEQLVNQVQRGQQIDVYVDPLQIETSGKVAGVIPLGPSAARTFPVKIRLDDEGGQLKSGMSVTAAVPTGKQSPHLTVPRDAVLRSARDSVVWAVVDDKAIRVTVDVLFTHGDRFAVSAAPGYTGPPLQAGMAVVIEGGERLLFSGQPVKVMTRQAAATPAE